ncbi:MAG: long-chain fatty acid--CoA ligase [Rhizobiales bacterium PAR1]|nr:MAG: long-chain fatty acid--CoA ligase [Rhizobiales bacterium PAR1]
MLGLMQDRPLLISSLLAYAETYHGATPIVSRDSDGSIFRYDYTSLGVRARKLANVLLSLGVKPGDRVATLAWNTHRHLELYFAASGIGAILHTVNPRLFTDQITYILNHAEDSLLFFDLSFTGLVEDIAGQLPKGIKAIALASAATTPAGKNIAFHSYEALLEGASDQFDWPHLDETSASSLCYTSGTTGNPKGVLYSHRSTVLHAWLACMKDGFALSIQDSVMLVVPLFHVNAWGIPYAAAMCGAKLVLPGHAPDGKVIYELMAREGCNFSLGVPTIWLNFFKYIDETPSLTLSDIKLDRVVIGGSAAPRSVIERFHATFGAFVIQAWGMSETSPVSTVGTLLPKHKGLPLEKIVDIQVKQGRAMFGVELKIVDDDHKELPKDGTVSGHLLVRGPWVTAGYFKGEGGKVLDAEGWFSTGDVATIDSDGYVQLTDRSKDIIKSGGEWISSIDLENCAVGCPGVQEAAVIGVAHPKWQERPLLLIIPKPGVTLTRDTVLAYLSGKIPKWWTPDDVLFVAELPHTATGKLLKMKLRQQFGQHLITKGGLVD